MQKIELLMNMISENLRMLWGALAVLVILANIQACTLAPQKRKVEIWLIDGEADVLYRRTGPGQEQAIPISRNTEAMDKFMCIHKDEADYWIEEMIDE